MDPRNNGQGQFDPRARESLKNPSGPVPLPGLPKIPLEPLGGELGAQITAGPRRADGSHAFEGTVSQFAGAPGHPVDECAARGSDVEQATTARVPLAERMERHQRYQHQDALAVAKSHQALAAFREHIRPLTLEYVDRLLELAVQARIL